MINYSQYGTNCEIENIEINLYHQPDINTYKTTNIFTYYNGICLNTTSKECVNTIIFDR